MWAEMLQIPKLPPVLKSFPLAARWVKLMVPSLRLELLRIRLLFDPKAQHLASPT